jgi:Cu/Ag efflux protein CusF
MREEAMKRRAFLMLIGGAALGFFCATAPALAQNRPPTPVTGVVLSVDAKSMQVRTADGKTVSINLPADLVTVRNQKASFSDIKTGDFVASAALQQQDGKLHAQELRIFPEAMRGIGEGHRPMALPNQTMTNASVVQVVGTSGGGVVTTKYPGGTTDIVVDPTTPVTKIVSVDRAELKPGVSVSVRATPGSDGALSARIVTLQ